MIAEVISTQLVDKVAGGGVAGGLAVVGIALLRYLENRRNDAEIRKQKSNGGTSHDKLGKIADTLVDLRVEAAGQTRLLEALTTETSCVKAGIQRVENLLAIQSAQGCPGTQVIAERIQALELKHAEDKGRASRD